MGIPLEPQAYYDNGGGLDLKSSPTKVAKDCASLSLNVDYDTDGAFFTRNGSTIMNTSGGIPAQMSGAPRTLALFNHVESDGTSVQLVCAGTTIKSSLTTPVNQVTGLSGTLPIPDLEFFVTPDDEYTFWGNGVDTNLKFDGTTWTNWSLPIPSNPTFNAFAAGALTGAFQYYVTFARTVLGVIVQESALNPTALTVNPAGQSVTINIPVSADSQVNARVIYRISPTSAGVAYRLAIVADNVTTTYLDNTAADGTIEADFDNQPAPTTAILEEYGRRMYMRDDAQKTDAVYSIFDKPWNVPTENRIIFDGPIQCMKRCFGALIVATDRSLWVLDGDIEQVEPRRISSLIGIVNNRCAVGEDVLYFLGTNQKIYRMTPTDFSQAQMRLDDPISTLIEPLTAQINAASLDLACMEYYTAANVAKVVLSAAIGGSTNNRLIIFNETQSQLKNKPVWQVWNNWNVSAIKLMNVGGNINLYSGDYNGFLWKLDDPSIKGDGTEQNGTATAATATTLADTTQTWTVNAFVGMTIRIIGGLGEGQVRTISSNTATEVTISSAWTTTPDTTSEFTIGGYDNYHFSNWKHVIGSYDHLKQLWFIWANANASGDYPIQIILQLDYDQSEANQTNILLNLQAANAIWGSFIWGAAIWGASAVFQDRIRQFARFRAIRIGFMSRQAGHDFQINGFSLDAQNKGKFF